MRMLDILYSESVCNTETPNSENFIKSINNIDAFLSRLSLDFKKETELEELIFETQSAAERQGFESGFN